MFLSNQHYVTTPGPTSLVHGIGYMGLFLFKDGISLWGIRLSEQLFREKGHPGGKQQRIIKADGRAVLCRAKSTANKLLQIRDLVIVLCCNISSGVRGSDKRSVSEIPKPGKNNP